MNRDALLMDRNTHVEGFYLSTSLSLEWNNRVRPVLVKAQQTSGSVVTVGLSEATICSHSSFTCKS